MADSDRFTLKRCLRCLYVWLNSPMINVQFDQIELIIQI